MNRQCAIAYTDVLRLIVDAMMSDSHQALSFPAASSRDIESLKNLVEGTSSISRLKSAYLEEHDDLLNLTVMVENAMTRIEGLFKNVIIFSGGCCRKVSDYYALMSKCNALRRKQIRFLRWP